MRQTILAAAALATAIAAILDAAPAAAATRTWVASNGTDSANNGCAVYAPCRTLAFAYSQTAAGGEIDILGPGNYGDLTIGKAISIASDGAEAGIQPMQPQGANPIVVNAGATDLIQLRGLTLDGAANTAGNGLGVEFLAGGGLLVRNCIVKNFQSGYGIYFAPNTAASLVVYDTTVTNNGSIGIYIGPLAGPTKTALERVVLDGNGSGLFVGGNSAAAINVTVTDSLATGNAMDSIIVTPSGTGPVVVMVEHSRSVNNGFGVRSFGANSTVLLDNSTVTGNGTGLAFGGGVLGSYGNNTVDKNGADGAPSQVFFRK